MQTYNGGNKLPNETDAMARAMHDIRQTIFKNSNAQIDSMYALALKDAFLTSHLRH
jgi:hypothetical protein